MFSSKLQPNKYHFLTLHHFLKTNKLNSGLLTWSAAEPIYWHQIVVKENIAFIASCPKWSPSKENWQLVLKRPQILNGFQKTDFKSKMRERLVGCVFNSGLVIWSVVDGEATGRCVSGISVIDLLVQPVWGYVLLVNMQLTSSTWWKGVGAFSICKRTQGYDSEY